MRLSKEDLEDIKEVFKKNFLPEDHLWLFGSRVDDDKRGGDIDLYIETNYTEHSEIWKARMAFWRTLQRRLGEQKIDIVIKYAGHHIPIHDVARQEGVILV